MFNRYHGHNICTNLAVNADNDIGFTVIQIAAHIVVIIEGKHKMQRREMWNERAFTERAKQLLRWIDVGRAVPFL